MCIFDGPSAPEYKAPPASATASVARTDKTAMDARDSQRRRRAAASGQQSTILTGAAGDTAAAPTAMKTLLGS